MHFQHKGVPFLTNKQGGGNINIPFVRGNALVAYAAQYPSLPVISWQIQRLMRGLCVSFPCHLPCKNSKMIRNRCGRYIVHILAPHREFLRAGAGAGAPQILLCLALPALPCLLGALPSTRVPECPSDAFCFLLLLFAFAFCL